jgi:hypothetical protein
MSSTSASDDQDLPSSVGRGWLNISIDDPQRDRRILTNNIMRELCQMSEQGDVAIADIPTIQAFDREFVEIHQVF